MSPARTPTPVDAVAEAHLEAMAAHDPGLATYWGIAGHDDRLPEHSPDWYAERSALRRRTLAALDATEPQDASDRITVAALRDELTLAEQLRELGTEEGEVNVIASPLQDIRDTFDLTSTADLDAVATIARRLDAVGPAVDGWIESLRLAARSGALSPRRQLEAGVRQSADNVGPDGFFAALAAQLRPDDGTEVPAALRADLERGAEVASDAYARLHDVLRDELLPQAPTADACGRERYQLHSRTFLGAQVDLEETYAWGQEELARITAEMQATADRIRPGASVAEAIAALDADETRVLHGTDELQRWMQRTSDAAVEALADVHFDIPAEIRRLECRIAPTQQGGIYYTGPSEDLVTRPGRMWWSVPSGITDFGTWREKTTVYHEGVPGHHLQIAQTVYRKDLLNRWRRLACWISGTGEGWALYAERLMADLGFLDDPADFLGMLDGQSMRAARVVLDIGFHCGFDAPAEVGGGAWDYDKAWAFLSAHVNMAEGFLRFELDRYLGWPGQAPSYKLGERLWLELRDEARAAADAESRLSPKAAAFDIKAFHRQALDVGAVGLDVLRAAVLGEYA
jgi:uncharacterized protein (DUF885 family)